MSNIFKSSKRKNENKKINEEINQEINEERKNFFMKKKEKKENFVFEEENFPSLGTSNTKSNVEKSFSAALNHVEKSKKKEKDKWAGWIIMKKDGTIIRHQDSGRYQRVRAMLDELNEERRQIRFEKRIYELEREKEIEYYLNGPDYIQSWEVDSYLENRKKEIIKDEEQSDYSDYEDYSD